VELTGSNKPPPIKTLQEIGVPDSVLKTLAGSYLPQDYLFLSIGRVGKPSPDVTQEVREVSQGDKVATFRRRQRAFSEFRSGTTPVMVTTNMMSRGIDISGISLVINYDLPQDDSQLCAQDWPDWALRQSGQPCPEWLETIAEREGCSGNGYGGRGRGRRRVSRHSTRHRSHRRNHRRQFSAWATAAELSSPKAGDVPNEDELVAGRGSLPGVLRGPADRRSAARNFRRCCRQFGIENHSRRLRRLTSAAAAASGAPEKPAPLATFEEANAAADANSRRARLLTRGAVAFFLLLCVALAVALPIALSTDRARRPVYQPVYRDRASGAQREIDCGVLEATNVSLVAVGNDAVSWRRVYRFDGVPFACRQLGQWQLLPARPVRDQPSCAQAWRLTPDEVQLPWHRRGLRYPWLGRWDSEAIACSQVDIAGRVRGDADCLYLDLATPAVHPLVGEANEEEAFEDALPTVVVLAGACWDWRRRGIFACRTVWLLETAAMVTASGSSARHRLGAAGHLTHRDLNDESPWRDGGGNMALGDAGVALGWLRRNLRAFGASPGNRPFHKLWLSSPALVVQQRAMNAMQMDNSLFPCLRAACREARTAEAILVSVPWSNATSASSTSGSLLADFGDLPALPTAPNGAGVDQAAARISCDRRPARDWLADASGGRQASDLTSRLC
uniref:Helicase C-terminal domain-containing protein n=1 Tax=Macrostomum lignano TaxID=282301 RepID=A0A1I8FCL1_9PLAT